jgi:hypothetical protein
MCQGSGQPITYRGETCWGFRDRRGNCNLDLDLDLDSPARRFPSKRSGEFECVEEVQVQVQVKPRVGPYTSSLSVSALYQQALAWAFTVDLFRVILKNVYPVLVPGGFSDVETGRHTRCAGHPPGGSTVARYASSKLSDSVQGACLDRTNHIDKGRFDR